MHPHAFNNNRSGACGMKVGDRVVYAPGGEYRNRGVADEFLHDGDAYVTWDDGSFETVKWNHLYPEAEWGERTKAEYEKAARNLKAISQS